MRWAVVVALAGCTAARPVDRRRGPSAVHAPGILDPTSSEFHGELLRSRGYDFGFCEKCHGEDLGGGKAASSCLTCHPQNPKSCTTCHGLPPATGAHQKHAIAGLFGKQYDCGECHRKPLDWSDPGHVRDAAGMLDPAPTEIQFGPLAGAGVYTSGTCTNVYCHGAATPNWIETGTVVCGSCHGLPPAGHPGGTCDRCHSGVANAAGSLINLNLHLDGKVSLGDDSGTCLACHPQPGGAHRSHTEALHGLSAKIECRECHVVPTAVSSPGHLSPTGLASVFPSGGVGAAAGAYGAMPSWDVTTQRCADVQCHGGGTKLAADVSMSVVRTPQWIPGSGALLCGACHGLPPKDGVHDSNWTLTDCASCHPQSIDVTGQLKPASHVNGVIDVR